MLSSCPLVTVVSQWTSPGVVSVVGVDGQVVRSYGQSQTSSGQIVKSEQGERFPLPSPFPLPPFSLPLLSPLSPFSSPPFRSRPLKGGFGERCKLPQRGLGRSPS